MDMNKTFFLRKEDRKPRWIKIDAKGQILGRLATRIADILRGKHVAYYTPHTDAGDYVVVVNAKDVVFSGNKWENKTYATYSGWMGGYKEVTAETLEKKHPGKTLELAIKRMLPKTKMANAMMKKLRIYQNEEHPHQAQVKGQEAGE